MADPPLHDIDALCRRILAANSDTISIQNPEIAVRKLGTILSAALALSNEKGFHAMSLRDLSRQSGVSMGGLYAYFDSKTTLLRMILTVVTETVRDTLSNPPAHLADDPVGQLEWLIDTHVRLTEDMLPWFTFAFMEAKTFPKDLRRIATASEELTEGYIAEICDRAVALGLFRADLAPITPALIKPLLQDWYVKRTKYRRRRVGVGDYIKTVQDIVLRACLTPAQQDLHVQRREGPIS